MPYTSQGFMTTADLADYRYDTDTGFTVVYLDDPPAWFRMLGPCSVCGWLIALHESVTVTNASGEIYACTGPDGVARSLPADDEPFYC